MPDFADPTGVIRAKAASLGISTDDPNVAAAIQSVQQAAVYEGIDTATQESLSRVSTLFDSFHDLYDRISQGGVTNAATTALGAARQYVAQNHELAGAIDTTSGLLQAASSMQQGGQTPMQLVQQFTGPLISAAMATGLVSTGVGAAIVAGIAVVSKLLDDSGLMPPPATIQICGGFKVATPPSFVVGCMAVYDSLGPGAPGAVDWRHFPEKSNPEDAWWYAKFPANGPTSWQWKNAKWQVGWSAIDPGVPIIHAFLWLQPMSNWAYNPNDKKSLASMVADGVLPKNISAEQLRAFGDFSATFFQAWKANKEYWLNGRKGVDADEIVLRHAVQLWNRSHQPGQGIDVGNSKTGSWSGGDPYVYWGAPGWTALVSKLSHQGAGEVLDASGRKIHLNTGPLLSVQRVPPLKLITDSGKKVAVTPTSPVKPVPTAAQIALAASRPDLARIAAAKPKSDVSWGFGAAGAIAGYLIGGPVPAIIGGVLGAIIGPSVKGK